MSLRRKLVFLHLAFAGFAVAATLVTVYGIQVHLHAAVDSFDSLIDQSRLADQLRVDARSQLVALHEIVNGRREADDAYVRRSDAFFTRLAETGRYAGSRTAPGEASTADLVRETKESFTRCLALVAVENRDDARALLTGKIEHDLLPALDARLAEARSELDARRRASGSELLATQTRLLWLALLVAVGGAGLVAAGAIAFRHWFLRPLAVLQTAAAQFGEGNLEHRVRVDGADELAALGRALNDMASGLRASQSKYRSLFENLRDAVLICDDAGRIVECRDSDTGLLGIDPAAAIGSKAPDVWPAWRDAGWDWEQMLREVAAGRQVRRADVPLPGANGHASVVDVVAYPVDFGDRQWAAVLLRDATERNRAHQLARRSATMEAMVNFARGVGHDFKNLLNSAITALSLVDPDRPQPKDGHRARLALRACEQAVGLSRRLSDVVSSEPGGVEELDLGETVAVILGSLDEATLARVTVRRDDGAGVQVRIDRDDLTQIALNLVYNAIEAMPDGGVLRIATRMVVTAHPVSPGSASPFGVLEVADTGCGIAPPIRERIFEPFYSTKPDGPSGRRGLGLTVVHAAVQKAGGFVQLESDLGRGTTLRVFLPAGHGAAPPQKRVQ